VLDLSLLSVLVVGAETTFSAFGPILPSFRNFFCVVIIADIVYSDYYYFDIIRTFHLLYVYFEISDFLILKFHISRFIISSSSSSSQEIDNPAVGRTDGRTDRFITSTLSVCLFSVTPPNPTHQLSDPPQPNPSQI